MKFFVSLLVVFMMVAFVASPVMACGHGHDDQDDGCGSGHTGDTEMFEGGNDSSDTDHGDGGGCSGDSCHI